MTTEAIADDKRLEKEVLEEKFLAAHPTILGALLDGVVAGLRGRAAARAAMKRKPRMADFAVFAAAAAPAFGWTAEQFLEAYEANRKNPGRAGGRGRPGCRGDPPVGGRAVVSWLGG